jgi:hypothetical protein
MSVRRLLHQDIEARISPAHHRYGLEMNFFVHHIGQSGSFSERLEMFKDPRRGFCTAGFDINQQDKRLPGTN